MLDIKKGTTRITFLVGNYAIKIPILDHWESFLEGLLGNMNETRFTRIFTEAFCPVVFSLPYGFLNIMKHVQPLTEQDFLCFDYHYWCNYQFKYQIVFVKHKQDSFGWLDGKIVACDYGN